MSNINIISELSTARSAAIKAGDILKNQRIDLNLILSSTKRDIKLQADVTAENLIKSLLEDESSFPILAEESGKSEKDLNETFSVVDPLDGTANYARGIPLCCV